MKVKEAIKVIEQDGWFMIRRSGLKYGTEESV